MNIKMITSLSLGLLISGASVNATPIASSAYEYQVEQKDDYGIEVKKQALRTMQSVNEIFRDLRSADKASAIDVARTNSNSLIGLLEKADTESDNHSASKASYEKALKLVKQADESLVTAKQESGIRRAKQALVEAKKKLGKALGYIDKAIGQNQ